MEHFGQFEWINIGAINRFSYFCIQQLEGAEGKHIGAAQESMRELI